MHRTQLYLDDHLWNALRTHAKKRKSTVSELVREAVRERYFNKQDARQKAMEEFIGIRKDSPELLDGAEYIRSLRRGSRLGRLYK